MMTLVLVLSAMLSAQAGPVLAPTGKWTVGFETGACTLSRDFAEEKSSHTFGLIWYAFAEGVALFDISDARTGQIVDGQTKVYFGPLERVIEASYQTLPLDRKRGRVLRVWMKGDAATALAGVQRVRISGGGADTPTFELGNTVNVLATFRKCQNDLLRDLGIDPAEVAAIATPAEAIKPGEWITDGDYPRAALMNGLQGETRFLWTIGADGRVSDCRVLTRPGHDILDRASCASIVKRGRYKPALNAAGNPVRSWINRSVRWRVY